MTASRRCRDKFGRLLKKRETVVVDIKFKRSNAQKIVLKKQRILTSMAGCRPSSYAFKKSSIVENMADLVDLLRTLLVARKGSDAGRTVQAAGERVSIIDLKSVVY